MSVAGISLVPGQVVVLALDGTLVYIEDVQPTFAAVIALPEQPSARTDERVFTPGRVGVKKISPYSKPATQVEIFRLSERNKEFIGTYETLRDKHGPHFVQRTPEEEAAMAVTKAKPPKDIATASPRQARVGKGTRAMKRAAARAAACATCGECSAHPNHPTGHAFVAKTEVPMKTGRGKPARSSAPTAEPIYKLVALDLTAARAQPRGEKFNEGNRSYRVFLALKGLPDSAGTLEDVITAVCTDGAAPPSNPEKIVRRTLNQLTTEEFGSCVTKS